jgi:hypothetical protein
MYVHALAHPPLPFEAPTARVSCAVPFGSIRLLLPRKTGQSHRVEQVEKSAINLRGERDPSAL